MKKITNKDWVRMLDLVLTESEGESVAKSIKDKDKAAARFICGLKLMNEEITFSEGWRGNVYAGSFECFGNKAIELGADIIEILNVYRRTEVPTSIIDKRRKYYGKKMDSWVVSFISKAIIDAGFDINYLNNGGNAITQEGRYAMERNGCKWTIGYRTEVIIGENTHAFNFDAITDEGDGPTSYILDSSSSSIFNNISNWDRIGKNKFKSSILKSMKEAA